MRQRALQGLTLLLFGVPALAVITSVAAPLLNGLGLRGFSDLLYMLLSYICPQIPSHSLWLLGAPTGISSRSLFLYAGFVVAGTLMLKREVFLRVRFSVLLLLPILVDALSHGTAGRASDNFLRVVTGSLAGIGIAGLVVPLSRRLMTGGERINLRGLSIFNRAVVVVVLVTFILAVLPAPRVTAQGKVTIPEGTRLAVKTQETLSSETAKQGQLVRFEVVRDVEVEGKTVIKAGAPAVGEVIRVASRKMIGREGELQITIRYATAVDGSQVPLRASLAEKGEGKLETTVVLGVVLCPLFLLMKGEEAVIPAGTEYNVFVDRPVAVTARAGGPVLIASYR